MKKFMMINLLYGALAIFMWICIGNIKTLYYYGIGSLAISGISTVLYLSRYSDNGLYLFIQIFSTLTLGFSMTILYLGYDWLYIGVAYLINMFFICINIDMFTIENQNVINNMINDLIPKETKE